MKSWLLVGWAAAFGAAWGCGPSEVHFQPDAPDDDLDGPIFVRFDARPKADASGIDASTHPPDPDAPLHDEPDAGGAVAPVTFDPTEIFVARGGTATVQIVLAKAAADDTVVALGTTTAAASVPTNIIVPAGQTRADVTVSGLTIGGASVTAGDERALVHVVPPITSLSPAGPTDVRAGGDLPMTVTLQQGSDVDVPITFSFEVADVVTVGAAVTIPARQSSFDVTLHGAHLGVTRVHARIGNSGADATVRVNGLFLSEILYDADGNDGGKEWIELKNDTDLTIDMTRVNLAVALATSFQIIVPFTETMAPGECAVYTMPPDSADPTGQTGILGNGTDGDGIRLVIGQDQVLDEVIYGDNNDDGIPGENDVVPDVTDVADVAPTKTIARNLGAAGRPWTTPVNPSDGDCTQF